MSEALILPPHVPEDLVLIERLLNALEGEEEVPPVVTFRRGRFLQSVTGSHRLAAWAQYELLTGKNARRVLILTDEEMREALDGLRLGRDIEAGWTQLKRIGELVSTLHWNATQPELKAALAGQW